MPRAHEPLSQARLEAPSIHAIAAAHRRHAAACAYLADLALIALSFARIPAIGAAVVGWAAVLASQGKLNIAVVLIVAELAPRPVTASATGGDASS